MLKSLRIFTVKIHTFLSSHSHCTNPSSFLISCTITSHYACYVLLLNQSSENSISILYFHYSSYLFMSHHIQSKSISSVKSFLTPPPLCRCVLHLDFCQSPRTLFHPPGWVESKLHEDRLSCCNFCFLGVWGFVCLFLSFMSWYLHNTAQWFLNKFSFFI